MLYTEKHVATSALTVTRLISGCVLLIDGATRLQYTHTFLSWLLLFLPWQPFVPFICGVALLSRAFTSSTFVRCLSFTASSLALATCLELNVDKLAVALMMLELFVGGDELNFTFVPIPFLCAIPQIMKEMEIGGFSTDTIRDTMHIVGASCCVASVSKLCAYMRRKEEEYKFSDIP